MEKQIPSTKCRNPRCTAYCKILNPMKLLKIYQQKRVSLHNKIKTELYQQPNNEKLKQLYEKVKYHGSSYLFIKQNGEVFKTTDLNKVIKEVIKINNLEEPNRYTAYSTSNGYPTPKNTAIYWMGRIQTAKYSNAIYEIYKSRSTTSTI